MGINKRTQGIFTSSHPLRFDEMDNLEKYVLKLNLHFSQYLLFNPIIVSKDLHGNLILNLKHYIKS